MADKIAVLLIIDSEAQRHANAGDAQSALMLNHIYMAVDELLKAGRRTTTAFRALGESKAFVEQAHRRHECEVAMIALDAALARIDET